MSIGRETHTHTIIRAEKTSLPPPISTNTDIEGGRCEYIEAHQAHERRPLRAASPLIGAGRAPLQAVAGRYAPPPHCLSADAFGCRVWAPLRPCSVSCRERSLWSRSLHDTSRRTLTVACRDYPRLPPPHAGRFSARFARLAQMLPSQALQMPGKVSRVRSWRQTTSLRSVVHRQERTLLALLLLIYHPRTPLGVAPPPTPSPLARPPRHPWGANSPLLGRGFPEPPPPLVASGLALTVAPPFFITVHALLMRNFIVIGSSSAFGHIGLFASFGRVALVGLLRPVCCRARHHARSLRRSRYARQSGIGLRPHFLSAGALCCGALFAWFPYVASAP